METNGVARDFWTEMLDVRAVVQDVREKRAAKPRQKRLRRTDAVHRPARPS
jgi:hypothetical protein